MLAQALVDILCSPRVLQTAHIAFLLVSRVCHPERLRSHTASQPSCLMVCCLGMSQIVSSCILCPVPSSRSACIGTSHLWLIFHICLTLDVCHTVTTSDHPILGHCCGKRYAREDREGHHACEQCERAILLA